MSTFRYKNSKNWWYDFQFDGRRYRESTKTSSRTLAREAERARRRQLEEGFNSIRKREKPKSFPEAAAEYVAAKGLTLKRSSLRIEKRSIVRLTPSFKKKLLNDITAADIRKYQLDRLAVGAAAKSINLDVSTLRAILRRNKLWSDIQPDFKMLKAREDAGRAISWDEDAILMQSCLESRSRSLYPGVQTAMNTGMRRSEVTHVIWKRLDFSRRLITVGESKTAYGERRQIPINDRLFAVLQSWAAQFPDRKPEHYVFPSERIGNRRKSDGGVTTYRTNPTKPILWTSSWQKAVKRAGIKCRFHDLRHTACTRMLEAKKPFLVVADVMGWSPATAILMAKRYGHIGQTARADAVAALNGPPQGPEITLDTICPRMLQFGIPFAVIAKVMAWSEQQATEMARQYGQLYKPATMTAPNGSSQAPPPTVTPSDTTSQPLQ